MTTSFYSKIAPVVDRYYDLHPNHHLSITEREQFAIELESLLKNAPLPRLVHYNHYSKDTPDSDENTLGNSGVNPFPKDALTFPSSEQEIIDIVKRARRENSIVRIIGTAHSNPSNIILDAPGGNFPPNTALLSLNNYRGVSIDKMKERATVKAGTNIHIDPHDPSSTKENSLAQILHDAGYALPDLGGVTHQAIGGFLSTGSAGGSLLYGFHDAVYAFSFIDGTGTKRTVSREDPDPTLFYAVGVSVGLCGVITEVVLSLTPTFNITGTQQTSSVSPLNPDWTKGCPVNLFGPTLPYVADNSSTQTIVIPGIVDYFREPRNEYMRMLYWPQPDMPPRVQIWTGSRTQPAKFPIKAYKELSEPLQVAAMIVLWILWQLQYGRNTPGFGEIEKEIAGKVLGLFMPLKESVGFSDVWFKTLPMDDTIDDYLMPTCFMEMWFDVDRADEAMRVLRDLNNNNSASIGNFFIEIYSAKKSPFWLSPSYTGDKIRLDVNFFQYDTEFRSLTERYDPKDFFKIYSDYFDAHGPPYTSHLGKYLPSKFGELNRLRRMYPKYDDWMKIRAQLDPDQVFVTHYWRQHLLIPAKSVAV